MYICNVHIYIYIYIYVTAKESEKLVNMHIFRLLCIILKTGLFIRDFE